VDVSTLEAAWLIAKWGRRFGSGNPIARDNMLGLQEAASASCSGVIAMLAAHDESLGSDRGLFIDSLTCTFTQLGYLEMPHEYLEKRK
jgi:hypothetical protein